jgi:hypothetical protein
VDLNAEMPSFSAAEKARVSEFDFSLSLVWHQSGRLSAADVAYLVDAALLWRVTSEADTPSVRDALSPAMDRAYDAVVQMLIGKGVFRAVLPNLANPADPEYPHIAAALARAMPWWKKFREFTPEQRREAYEGLWTYYLKPENRKLRIGDLKRIADDTLEKRPEFAGLGHLELASASNVTFTGLIVDNPDTGDACDRFTRGMGSLQQSIEAAEFDDGKRIPKVFDDISALWAQSHHVRALGAYLLDAADRKGVLGDVKRTLTMMPKGLDVIVVASL